METKDWYKLTFLIESDSEEVIIWKLNELGIFSFSFEYLIKNENKKEVNIWLPIDDWSESSRSSFEKIISKLLNIKPPKNQFFNWSIIKEEDWLTSWKKYWGPQLVGNHLLILRSSLIMFSKLFLELSSHSSIGSHIFTSFVFSVFIKYSNEKLKMPISFNFQMIISSISLSI